MGSEGKAAALSDAELESLRRRRFEERVERVQGVMREERIDWQGIAFLTAEGTVGVRVVPVEARGEGM